MPTISVTLPEGQGTLPEFVLSGPNGADLGNQYLSTGTILTPFTSQLSNTPVAEIDYGLTRTTSLTANGSYAMLDFPDSSLLDTTQRNLGGGMNHSYGRNTVGVSYNNTMFRYANAPESMQTHAVQLSFARRVSAKYSLDAYIGPEIVVSKTGVQSTTQFFATGHFALRWRAPRTTASLLYSRNITNGSGITTGAKTDLAAATIDRTVERDVILSGSLGYARNAATLVGGTYDTINAMAGISRHLGRRASLSLDYFYQFQTSNSAFDNLQNQVITCAFTWNFRPVRFK